MRFGVLSSEKGGPRGQMSGSLHDSLYGSIHETVPVLFEFFAGVSVICVNRCKLLRSDT